MACHAKIPAKTLTSFHKNSGEPDRHYAEVEVEPRIYASSYKSPTEALKRLGDVVLEHAKIGADFKEFRSRRHLIFCGDGTLLIVSWTLSWEYAVLRADDNILRTSCSGMRSFEEACEYARRHAEQSFGGIEREVGS